MENNVISSDSNENNKEKKEINVLLNKEEKENGKVDISEKTEMQELLNKKENENGKIENKEKKTEPPKKKQRQSNIELLRIIAMYLIISHHFSIHGNFSFSKNELTVNQFWLKFITIGGRIAVDTYVLNSGYFLINSKSVKINKVLKMLFQMYTYAILDFIVGYIAKVEGFGWYYLFFYLFPISLNVWWFASNYVILYLLSTTINKLLNTFDRAQYKTFLLFTTLIWTIIPALTTQNDFINNLIWFFYMYCFSGYIRRYSLKDKNYSGILFIGISILIYLLTFGFLVFCSYRGVKSKYFSYLSTRFYVMNIIPVFASAAFLFLGFLKLNITSKFINFVSATTFGIYLIHDGRFINIVIWEKIFKNNTYKESDYLIPYSIGVSLIVFIGCSIIETIRIYTIEKLYLKFIDNLSIKIDNLYQKFINSKFINKF